MITYLDDILIYSENLEEHRRHVHKVLARLKERALYVKRSKSRFETKEVRFLGYVIRPGQIEKDPEKTAAVRDWPRPS